MIFNKFEYFFEKGTILRSATYPRRRTAGTEPLQSLESSENVLLKSSYLLVFLPCRVILLPLVAHPLLLLLLLLLLLFGCWVPRRRRGQPCHLLPNSLVVGFGLCWRGKRGVGRRGRVQSLLGKMKKYNWTYLSRKSCFENKGLGQTWKKIQRRNIANKIHKEGEKNNFMIKYIIYCA